ncbi:MAG TPA: molybdopterin molybdenumtransferase MoeA, partial [Synergistaceae bacterium]|nr:molybdopterin molybdenumtransferase MoeA [Synergistaceae bacterium]
MLMPFQRSSQAPGSLSWRSECADGGESDVAGVLQDLTPREEGIAAVSRALAFPWAFGERTLPFEEAAGRRIMRPIIAPEDFPPYDRSTRDGYAVRSVDSHGATPANPVFLREAGEVVMGRLPTFALGSTECALIHTGGILPSGADAVVMTEDAEATKGWLEIRRAVQRMENVLSAGEEFRAGDVLLPAGRRLDFRTLGLLAMAGIGSVPLPDITVGIVSTGDEIVPAGTARLRPGQFRDVNSVLLASSLREEGYTSRFFGIAGDDRESLRSVLFRAMDECDVVLVSG